jgi:magnesium transporter
MIRSLYYQDSGELHTQLAIEDFKPALENSTGLLWVDFEATNPQDDEPIMRDVFGFHPLAIDDALQESHVPKLDDWGDYVYIVLHAVVFDSNADDQLDTLELDIFLGKNYMVTHHDRPITAIDRVWDFVHRDFRHLKNGADHLLYRLTDEVVASYMPAVEAIDDEIDHVEDQVFDQPASQTLEKIFSLKRATLHLWRIVGPQREVLNKLARDDYAVIDARARVYFRDVYDHLVRLHDITESLRDLVSGSLDTYLSVVNNRMNDIMKTLTIITTLFMPISFVASFFGMNFFTPTTPLEIWTGLPAFIFTIGLIVITPVAMFTWIRRRGWWS